MIVLIQSTDNVFFNFTSPANIPTLTTTANTGLSVSKTVAKCY